MKMFKRLCIEFFYGMLFGSMIWVLTGFFSGNIKYRIVYLVIFGLIGPLSELFNIDSLKPIYAFIIHFIGTFSLISILNIISGNFEIFEMPYLLKYIFNFVIIYIICWIISFVIFRKKTSEINDAIKKRNEH
ncbi:DUF3021 family protein [Apilactobacillus timberlakei]|uniref:DUF3021 family protein n=1 Tax=Apilactobacillus timberlakei TaxID=2008380 RepID=UPI00112C421B|nr:DUF3021 family protein [Apilactobacillus timberlakei]